MKPLAYLILPALLIAALSGGIVIGVKVMEPIHARELADMRAKLGKVEAERDAARKDALVWFGAVRRIVEGEQPEAIGIGRISEED